jgi:hypothetical protein
MVDKGRHMPPPPVPPNTGSVYATPREENWEIGIEEYVENGYLSSGGGNLMKEIFIGSQKYNERSDGDVKFLSGNNLKWCT